MAISKKDLVSKVAEATGKTKTEVDEIVSATIATIKSSVKDEEIRLLGFGSFKVVHKEERQGRNPKTKEAITIPARNAVKFTAGKDFKEAIQ